MKKIILLLLLLPGINFAQETTTSEEEYIFLTIGIKEQISKGLDVSKAGYSLDKIYDVKSLSGKTTFTFTKFVDSKNHIKAISIVMKAPDASPKDGIYYCFPINNDKLFKKYIKSVRGNMAEDDIIKATSEAMLYLLKQ